MTTPGSHGPGEQPPGGTSGWGQPAGGPHQPGSVPSRPPGAVPPPPPGSFPQGQHPPPQGQPGSFPPPPPGQYPQQQGGGWTPEPPKSGGAGKWIGIGAAVLAVLVVVIIALALLGGGTAEAGDCLRDDGGELTKVDCDDDTAEWRVLGVQEGEQTYDEYLNDPETCVDFPTTTQSFWLGENEDQTGNGIVYCVIGL